MLLAMFGEGQVAKMVVDLDGLTRTRAFCAGLGACQGACWPSSHGSVQPCTTWEAVGRERREAGSAPSRGAPGTRSLAAASRPRGRPEVGGARAPRPGSRGAAPAGEQRSRGTGGARKRLAIAYRRVGDGCQAPPCVQSACRDPHAGGGMDGWWKWHASKLLSHVWPLLARRSCMLSTQCGHLTTDRPHQRCAAGGCSAFAFGGSVFPKCWWGVDCPWSTTGAVSSPGRVPKTAPHPTVQEVDLGGALGVARNFAT